MEKPNANSLVVVSQEVVSERKSFVNWVGIVCEFFSRLGRRGLNLAGVVHNSESRRVKTLKHAATTSSWSSLSLPFAISCKRKQAEQSVTMLYISYGLYSNESTRRGRKKCLHH